MKFKTKILLYFFILWLILISINLFLINHLRTASNTIFVIIIIIELFVSSLFIWFVFNLEIKHSIDNIVYHIKKVTEGHFDEKFEKENDAKFDELTKNLEIMEEKIKKIKLSEDQTSKNKKLQIAYNKLKQIDQLKDNFLSNISHELRTPLTSIKSYNQLLYDEVVGKLNKDQKESLKIVLNSTDHLIGLINNLLDISRYSSKKAQFNFEDFDLKENIKKIIYEFKPTIFKIQGNISVSGINCIIKADKTKIMQVFRNLINNAIKYRKKSRKLDIKIHISKYLDDTGYIKITVKDNGIGIHKKDFENIFDKFYQVDQSITRKVEGDGLGLSIVKYIIESHKGILKVNSKINKWTEFTICLPKKKI